MHMAKRLASVESGKGIDFATAEAMAFGSLMLEGKHVRLCGQDSGRVRLSILRCLFHLLQGRLTDLPLKGNFFSTTRNRIRSILRQNNSASPSLDGSKGG